MIHTIKYVKNNMININRKLSELGYTEFIIVNNVIYVFTGYNWYENVINEFSKLSKEYNKVIIPCDVDIWCSLDLDNYLNTNCKESYLNLILHNLKKQNASIAHYLYNNNTICVFIKENIKLNKLKYLVHKFYKKHNICLLFYIL